MYLLYAFEVAKYMMDPQIGRFLVVVKCILDEAPEKSIVPTKLLKRRIQKISHGKQSEINLPGGQEGRIILLCFHF